MKRQKRQTEEQLQKSKSDRNVLSEELASIRKTLFMREAELEAIKSELSTKNNTIVSLKADKEALQRELETVNTEMVVSESITVEESAPVEAEFFSTQVSEYEATLKSSVEEKEGLQEEVLDLQSKLAKLQADYDRAFRDLDATK